MVESCTAKLSIETKTLPGVRQLVSPCDDDEKL